MQQHAYKISHCEDKLKTDIATCYRLIDHFGLDDVTDGFVSARSLDSDKHILIGAYGALPCLVQTSDILKKPLLDNPPIEKLAGADFDAILFSKAVYDCSPQYTALIHAHPIDAMAFSALDVELEPISQAGVMFNNKCARIPFNEDVTNESIRSGIANALLAGNKAIILENHGLIVPGINIADAFIRLYRLNQAMQIQLKAYQSGQPLIKVNSKRLLQWTENYWQNEFVDNDGSREWPAFVKMINDKVNATTTKIAL